MLKTFFTQLLLLSILIGLGLPSLSYAGTDTDGLGTNASDGEDSPCTGNYIVGVRAGSCDSFSDCNAFAGCNNTCDFDCDGVQDGVEYPGADPTTPAAALPDTDGDGVFDPCDLDDDGDGVPDQTAPLALTCPNAATYGVPATPDNCTVTANPAQTDTDGDGQGDACDDDDDGDSRLDSADACPAGDTGWTSNASTDHDSDGCRDAGEDSDDDNDSVADSGDSCASGDLGWISNASTDHDSDGCRDAGEDSDDDNDSVADSGDSCASGDLGWTSNAGTDYDSDGCQDSAEDSDDDNDSVADSGDSCASGDLGWISNAGTDHDSDGCRDAGEDSDDDNDSVADSGDSCASGDLGWTSNAGSDNDSDGCRDAGEDNDDDNDSVADTFDNCSLIANPDQANNDADADGDACDTNDDGDALADTADMCSLTPLSGLPIPSNNIDPGCDLICFLPHRGVPGQPAPPIIDGDVAADVGWRGAHRVTFGNGTDLPHLAFQTLRDNSADFFYLSFEVQNDDAGPPSAGDTIVVTFRPDFNTAATAFPAGNADDDIRLLIDVAGGTADVDKYIGGAWVDQTLPALTMAVNPAPAANAWDVEVAIPTSIAAGGASWVDFGNYFKFYVNVLRETGGSVAEFVWPEHGHRISGGDVLAYHYDNHEWGIGTRDNSAQCNGVFVNAVDIRTNHTPNNRIVWDPAVSNTFSADVQNLSWDSAASAWVQADDINVRFRIADWGIAGVGDLTATSWQPIAGSAPTPGCTATDRNPTCNQNIAAASNSTTPGVTTFALDWNVDAADEAKYNPAMGGYDHQCVLVELSSGSGANITTKSVYRNMNFSATASVFERKAKISAVGLGKPVGGQPEHQFILQEIRQLLKPVQRKDLLKAVNQAAAENPEQQDKQYIANHKQLVKPPSKQRPGPPSKPRPDPADPGSGDKDDWISKTRWLIHGYRETGNFVDIENVRYPLSEPVASFGYIVTHTGGFVSEWKHSIKGDGIEQLSAGTYRMAIPEGGFKEIKTRVESIEKTLTWWQILLMILFIIATGGAVPVVVSKLKQWLSK